MNEAQYERFRAMGRSCRQNGGKKTDCPYRMATSRDEYTAWHVGWNEADMEAKARARR